MSDSHERDIIDGESGQIRSAADAFVACAIFVATVPILTPIIHDVMEGTGTVEQLVEAFGNHPVNTALFIAMLAIGGTWTRHKERRNS